MRLRLLTLVACVLLGWADVALAQSGNASPPQPSSGSTPRPWWERLTFYGDFRVRYEGFFQEGLETRQRGRYRLRLGLRAPIAEGLDFNLRLASGDSSDVASSNQTLTDFLNRKPVNIDQASLTYTTRRLPGVTLGAGKFGYPVTRTQMVWDDDVNWEGAFEQWNWQGAALGVRLVAVQSPLQELAAQSDAFMFGAYAQATVRVSRHTLQVSVADYAFRNPDVIAVALDRRDVIRSQQTNSLRRSDAGAVIGYASGFNLVDVIAQATFATTRPEYPVTIVADYVVNTRAPSARNKGVWLTTTYGRAAAPRTFAGYYTFARIERDAVLSAFNFSDMGPATNVRMNMATISYAPRARVNLDFTAILTQLLDAPTGAPNPMLKRLQLDARVAF